MKTLTQTLVRSLLVPRKKDSHKGTYGHALLVAGNEGTMGAAVIAARACLRSGPGLLTVHIPKEERVILQTAVTEAMLLFREEKTFHTDKFSAIGMGPGLDVSKKHITLVNKLIKLTKQPLVIDADALNILALHKKLPDQLANRTILTPHPKEFDRLFGTHHTTQDRITTAIEKAKHYHIIIVLKGHETIITNGVETFRNTTGNAGLAKGGSGDALTGMITAFLAQGYTTMHSALIAVYIHGLAADMTLKQQSMESMLITDVIETIGKVFTSLHN